MAGQSDGAEVDDGLDVGHIHSGKDHKHEAAENREVLFDLQPIYDEKNSMLRRPLSPPCPE